MLSRVADAVYWMSRYIERAENVARFVEVNLNLMLDLPVGASEQWQPLVMTTGDIDVYRERYGEIEQKKVIHFLTFDAEYPNSIFSCLRSARENARSIREVISQDMWEAVNKFYLFVRDAGQSGKAEDDPYDFYAQVKLHGHLFNGITDGTLSHNEGWHFARMGRLLERADKTSRILDVKYFILLPQVEDVGTPFDSLQWAALLKSASALEMYRKRYGQIAPSHVADFLVLDSDFPRAMKYCVCRAEDSLRAITGTAPGDFANRAEQRLGRLRSELSYTRIKEIIDGGLHEYLDNFQAKLNDVDAATYEAFFGLKPIGQQTQTLGSQTQTQFQI